MGTSSLGLDGHVLLKGCVVFCVLTFNLAQHSKQFTGLAMKVYIGCINFNLTK